MCRHPYQNEFVIAAKKRTFNRETLETIMVPVELTLTLCVSCDAILKQTTEEVESNDK